MSMTMDSVMYGHFTLCFSVDLAGQLSSLSDRRFKTIKWPVAVFFHTIQTAAVNTYVLKRDSMDPRVRYKVTDCRKAIINGLLKMGRSRIADLEQYDRLNEQAMDTDNCEIPVNESGKRRFDCSVMHCMTRFA